MSTLGSARKKSCTAYDNGSMYLSHQNHREKLNHAASVGWVHFRPLRLFLNGWTKKQFCVLWQEEYMEGAELGRLDCGHDFHTACIKQWLMIKNLCPICKTTALSTWKERIDSAVPSRFKRQWLYTTTKDSIFLIFFLPLKFSSHIIDFNARVLYCMVYDSCHLHRRRSGLLEVWALLLWFALFYPSLMFVSSPIVTNCFQKIDLRAPNGLDSIRSEIT